MICWLSAFVLAHLMVGGASGFTVLGSSQALPTYPLKVSASKRYLVDGRNRPFLLHADTGWHLFYKLTKVEAEYYLENRRQKGFNTILVQLLTDGDYYPNRDGEFPLTSADDLSTPNEEFFQHVDWIVRKANEKGLQLMVAPAWLGCCKGGWREKLKVNGSEKCRQFGRYLGSRYKNYPNLMWLLGGDRKPEEYLEVVRAMALGIKETDARHLRTVHPSPPLSALDVYPNETWLDVNVTYTYSPDNLKVGRRQLHVYHVSRNDYNRTPKRPFVLIESTYEGEHGSPPQQVRLASLLEPNLLAQGLGHATSTTVRPADPAPATNAKSPHPLNL